MADKKTYRHRLTGLVDEYEPAIAAVFRHVLDEVKPGAKPLAYLPIPHEAVVAALANSSDEDEPADDKESDVVHE